MTMLQNLEATGIRMIEDKNHSLLRLMTWFSPSYPVGAYTYSHGLEFAVEAGEITDVATAFTWISRIVQDGTGKSDVILLNRAYEAVLSEKTDVLGDIAEMAVAYNGTQELELESQAQGRAFLSVTEQSWPCDSIKTLKDCWPGPYSYPVIVGVVAAGHGIDVRDVIPAYLHAFAANLVSALVRLIPLGQTDGQRLTAQLEPIVIETAKEALTLSLEDISNACLMVDLCSMQHETQHTRLFRS